MEILPSSCHLSPEAAKSHLEQAIKDKYPNDIIHRTHYVMKRKVSEKNPEFAINLENLVSELKKNLILKIIELKYGEEAGRVVRIIEKRGPMEEKEIKELALIEPEETVRILQKLFVNGIIQDQELENKSGAKIRVYMVKIESVIQTFILLIIKAIYNMKTQLSGNVG